MDTDEMDQNYSTNEINERVLESQEINDAEHDVIKGDTIGETLYSAKWILNVLISLSKVYEEGWNNSIENDLCTLWDMTTEKAIVEFLLENDFFKMAEFTLKTSEEPRLTEIIVGIVGNICCQKEALEILVNNNSLVSMIFSLITSDDKETLIQVLRILQATVWDIQKNAQSPWLEKLEDFKVLGEAICFILKSSTSDELLTPTIDFVYLISEIELPNKKDFLQIIFDVEQLIFALCEAMMELIKEIDSCHSENQLKNIENWQNIIFNLITKNLLIFSDDESDDHFKKIYSVLFRILQPYEQLNNLILSESKCLLCIQQCIKIVHTFGQNELLPNLELIQIILKIMINSNKALMESEFEDEFKQLYNYTVIHWTATLKMISKDHIREIFKLCDQQTVDDIIQVTKSLSGVSESCLDKLVQT